MRWAAGERNRIFYADDEGISVRDHIWVQDALTVSVVVLRWMVLEMNLDKTKALVFTPSYIWGEWSEKSYKRKANGEGETFM